MVTIRLDSNDTLCYNFDVVTIVSLRLTKRVYSFQKSLWLSWLLYTRYEDSISFRPRVIVRNHIFDVILMTGCDFLEPVLIIGCDFDDWVQFPRTSFDHWMRFLNCPGLLYTVLDDFSKFPRTSNLYTTYRNLPPQVLMLPLVVF